MSQRNNYFAFSIRDLIWLMLVVALVVCLFRDRGRLQVLGTAIRGLESELKTTQKLASVLNDMYRVTNYEVGTGAANGWPPGYSSKRLDSYDIIRLLLSKSDCVILGEVTDEPGVMMAHEAGTHYSMRLKVRIIGVAKGEGLPVGEQIDVHIDCIPDLFPRKGEKKVFLVGPANLEELHTLATDDIRFCVQPASLFTEFKHKADEMRNAPRQFP